MDKMESMQLETKYTIPFEMDNEIIEDVIEFCYLDRVITKEESSTLDVSQRTAKANQAFGMLRGKWKSMVINRKTKILISNS